MRAERAIQSKLDRVWMVAQWKWDLDAGTPWHRRLFFKYVFRPFLHFAWNVMKIPTPKAVEVKGDKQTFIWFENGGFFSSEDQAEIACVSPWHGYKDVPLDRAFPPESAQYSSLVFPRQSNPRQHRKAPTYNYKLVERKKDEQRDKQLAEALEQVNEVLTSKAAH